MTGGQGESLMGKLKPEFGIFSTSDLMLTGHAAKREKKCSPLQKANRKERNEMKRKKQKEKQSFLAAEPRSTSANAP